VDREELAGVRVLGRPGQERRPFTAAEARVIATELVRAADLVEAEGGEPKA